MNTGIFFDLDGTLWDSSEQVVRSWNQTFKNNGVDVVITQKDMQNCMGRQMREIADILLPGLEPDERYGLLEKCVVDENELIKQEGGILFDNVEQVLSKLSSKYKLFIISNCQEGYIEAFLEYYKLGKYITDTENPGVTGLSKGDNIKLVAERNDIDNIIYVGDTQGDYDATVHANGIFVHAAYGFGKISEETSKIYNIESLPDTIEDIVTLI